MPNVPWHVVAAQNPQQALNEEKFVLSGKTSADGKVNLSTAEEKQLRQAYDKNPGGLWLVFHAQVRQISLTPEREQWDDRQRHEQALDAMGFTDTLGPTGNAQVDQFVKNMARTETGASSGSAALGKLKG